MLGPKNKRTWGELVELQLRGKRAADNAQPSKAIILSSKVHLVGRQQGNESYLAKRKLEPTRA